MLSVGAFPILAGPLVMRIVEEEGKVTNVFGKRAIKVNEPNLDVSTNPTLGETVPLIPSNPNSLKQTKIPSTFPHPFFMANLKKRKESDRTQLSRNEVLDTAPLFPNVAHTCGANDVVYINFSQLDSVKMRSRGQLVLELPDAIDFDFGRRASLSFLNSPREPQKPRFNEEEFNKALQVIIKWIEDRSNKKIDSEDDILCQARMVDFQPKANQKNRPMVYLSGPTGTGKSRLATALTTHLNVPLMEVNAAVAVRNGKAFDDILSGSHNQRSMMSKFIGSKSSRVSTEQTLNGDIKMVVLIDEIDVVFWADSFYPALNSFLKSCPLTILCVITSNVEANVMRRLVDFPSGTLFYAMESPTWALEGWDDSPSIEDVLEKSDFEWISEGKSVYSYYHDDLEIQLCCIRHDCQQVHENIICRDFYQPWFEESSPPGDALLDDLHREGFMWGCMVLEDWTKDYRAFWRLLELDAMQRNEIRTRRTTREFRLRPYLAGIPESLLKRLRQQIFSMQQ